MDVYSFIADREWIEEINRWKSKELTCYKCGTFFYEIDNIGQWKCRQHASITPQNGEWSCCKKILGTGHVSSDGCVPSDHTTLLIPYTEIHNLPIPISLVQQLNILEKSVVLHQDPTNTDGDYGFNQVVVRRYDYETAEREGMFRLDPL